MKHVRLRVLLVIDIPDERARGRQQFDHMHAWFSDEGEAEVLKRTLEEQFGNGHNHEIVVDDVMAACPRCGAVHTSSGL